MHPKMHKIRVLPYKELITNLLCQCCFCDISVVILFASGSQCGPKKAQISLAFCDGTLSLVQALWMVQLQRSFSIQCFYWVPPLLLFCCSIFNHFYFKLSGIKIAVIKPKIYFLLSNQPLINARCRWCISKFLATNDVKEKRTTFKLHEKYRENKSLVILYYFHDLAVTTKLEETVSVTFRAILIFLFLKSYWYTLHRDITQNSRNNA